MALVVFALLTFAAAAFGAQFSPGAWYAALPKPSWTPPSSVFGPVWTLLYILIAVAGWLVWRKGRNRAALAAWGIGLMLNAAWSWLFFGLHAIGAALIDIALLWLSIVAFVGATWRDDRLAAGLFLPYLAWVSFAAALNIAIWRMAT